LFRVTSAMRPSRVKATPLGWQSGACRLTVPAGVTVFPRTVNTESVPSKRLATSASVPARLMATPDAPVPARSVAIVRGGEDWRSITVRTLS
jgi:hypothetical protein